MIRTYNTGTQMLWAINASDFTVINSLTFTEQNPDSVFTVVSNAILIAFKSGNPNVISIAGVDPYLFTPNSYINLIQDTSKLVSV